jgi:hypothetical protein
MEEAPIVFLMTAAPVASLFVLLELRRRRL